MNHPATCEQSCPLVNVCRDRGSCARTPHLCAGDVLARFEKEATRGGVDTDAGRAEFWTWGSGPPIVFVHGLADDSRSFLLPVSVLSASFRCVGFDLPAHPRTFTDLVSALFALIDHLGLPRSYAYGAGFGSAVVLAAAHAKPERLPRLVLQSPLVHKQLTWVERRLASLGGWLPGSMRRLPGWASVMRRNYAAGFTTEHPERFHLLLSQMGAVPISTVARRTRLLARLDLRPIVKEIIQPALVLHGDGEEELGDLSNAVRVAVPGCGRWASLTYPEMVAEMVRGFLTPSRSAPPERSPATACVSRESVAGETQAVEGETPAST